MPEYEGPWIQTLDGRALYLLQPTERDIHMSTLAIVLSRICRFGGHTRQFYSVAEHSLRVMQLVSHLTADPAIRLAAILYDAHEAYSGFGDVCKPARCLAPRVEEVQDGLDQVIAAKFGFDAALFKHDLVQLADARLLATEARDLMLPMAPPSWVDDLPAPLEQKIVPAQNIREVAWQFEVRARGLAYTLRHPTEPEESCS